MTDRSRAGSTSSGSDGEGAPDWMQEPEGFRPATPPPTVKTYTRRKFGGLGDVAGPETVKVGLVSGHPLWGHILYPAALAMSRYLELHAATLLHGPDGPGKGKGKAILELGAGGGLPGLVAALEGAGKVVISDFPDPALVNNLAKNVEMNVTALGDEPKVAEATAKGFTWGSSPTDLLSFLSPTHSKFDLILLSDLVFNHTQHPALLDSCLSCLAPASPASPPLTTTPSPSSSPPLPDVDISSARGRQGPVALCFFSHHRPWLVEADLGILAVAEEKGWKVEKVWEDREAGPAFPEDGGDLAVRSTVHGYAFWRE